MATHKQLLRAVALLGVCALILAIGTPDVGAVTITTADGAGADAYTLSYAGGEERNGQESGNSGGLNVRDTGSYYGDTYLKFDLSSLTAAADTAVLEMMVFFSHVQPTAYDIYGLNDSENADNWGEYDINWNNAPGNDTTNGELIGSMVTLLGTFTTPSDARQEGDIYTMLSGPNLVDFLNDDTDGKVTLILNHAGSVGSTIQLMGKSNTDVIGAYAGPNPVSHAPTLNITEVPEPGTLAMLAGALVGLAVCGIRRRR